MSRNYDYSKLNGKIREVCGTQNEFAKRMKKSGTIINRKLQNRVGFNQRDIEDAIAVLGIDRTEIPEFFFRVEGSKNLNLEGR